MRKSASGIMLTSVLIGMLTLSFYIWDVEGQREPTIIVNPDGTVTQHAPYIIEGDNQDRYHPTIPSAPPAWGDWTHYHNYAEIVDTLLYLNTTYPNIVDVFSIGKSWQNRDIYCIRLTNETNTHPKPEMLFIGYHHAREPISAELPLYFAVDAATNFGVNATLTHMLNYTETYVVPALNVDAFEAVEQNEWQRKNVHPFDEDGDSSLDEDPPDDQDGDGYIEDLWQWDGTKWIFLGWEGIDNDGDGFLNEDWMGGVDLNRNYGYQWDAPCQSGSPYPPDEDYRGPAPFSEPETQVIRDFALNHDFKYAVSYHSGADVILYPWGYTNTPTPDDQKFREIASNMSALVGSPYEQGSQMYTTSGVWDDWMYGNRSVFALTCEIYTNNSAWLYEPGPYPNSWWEKGVTQFFNPAPSNILSVVRKWLPVFTYIANRSITEAYDIAVTNVKPMKNIVGQGFSADINVTVMNQGSFTETLQVTTYANSIYIGSQAVTLSRGETKTVVFTWSTTGFAKGDYTISARATPVQGEIDKSDNNADDGAVTVTIAGDVDGDRDVDSSDLSTLSDAYGSEPSGSNGNSNCDINNDNKVDVLDIYYVGRNYGKTDP